MDMRLVARSVPGSNAGWGAALPDYSGSAILLSTLYW